MRIPTLRKSQSALSLKQDKQQQSQQPFPAYQHAAAAAPGSPTAILDAYGRPSIDSVALAKMQQAHHLDEQDEDNTAFSHHTPLLQDGVYDEDATIRFPIASSSTSILPHPPPNMSKKLPKPPRPPRVRPLSQAVSTISSSSIDYTRQLRENEESRNIEDDSSELLNMPSSSRNETIHVNPGHYLPSLERSESSSSNPHHQQYSSSFPSSSSSYPSRPDSLIVNSHSCSTSSVPSPLIDISSASSTASSYFIPTPALYEADEQPHDLNACKSLNHHHHHSERSLGRSSSQRTTALDRSRSLLRAGRGRYEEDSHHHNRASVYTTQTSASDWARERENEMRNSKSGIFDLEYELQESRSGSSNEGHEVVSSQQVSQRRIQGNGDNEDYIITEEDNQDSIGNQSAMSSASTSEFIAVSQPISPTSPSSMSSSMQLQTQLLNPQERLRLPKPLLPLPSPTSPTSPNSSAGFGLGITSDDAIHPIGNSALPPSVSSSSITGSPDSLSFTDTQLPDQPYEGSTLSSSSTAPKGRWSTTRAYIRRNTNSSLRSLNRQQSKSSLLDLQSITTTTNATTMNATFDNPTRSPSHHSSLQQSSGYTSLSEHLQSSQKQSSQQEQTRDDASPSAFPGYTNEPENIGYSRFGQNQQMTFSSSSMMEKSVSSLSSPYNNENSGTSSTHAPGMDSSRSAYTSNANSYLSTDSLVGDEREDINSQESPRKPNIRGLGMVDAGLIMDFPNADNSTTRPPSQAVAMAESGKGKVTRIEPFENIEHLQISSDTTHLIFNGVSSQPVLLSNLLSTSLPGIADKLLVLDISNCSLSNIPQSIFLCSNLEELNISGNTQINGTLPPFIRSLISLRVLLADSCGLNSISHSFANLKHLHTLALRNNSLKYLPSWISRLSNSLELLLLDDNPFYGDYADLVKSCSQLRHQSSSTSPSPTTEVPSPTRQISANPSSEAFAVEEEADNSFASNASARADSLESQEQNDVFLPGRIPAAVPKPPRTSLLSRTGSVRLALSRSMSISDNIPATQSSSPVNSLLLADSSSQASTARRRASILKPMKSMGDLNASQPSIHELISPSDKENLLPSMRFPASPAFPISPSFSDASTMESNTSTSSSARPSPILMQGQPSFRKSIAGSFAARRSRKSSRGLTALEFIASEVAESRGSQAPPNFPEPVSSANVSPVTTSADEKGRDGRPGFFKKLSMGVTRRRKSNSALNSDAATPPMPSSPPPPLPTEQAELGIGRPPFLNNGSLRSTSAPDSVSTRRPFSSRENAPEGLPPMPRSTTGLPDSPSTTWKSSIQSSIMENSRRYRKKSRPPIPEPLLELAKQEEESKPNRRRSYLMLNSVLPPVVSPGPLALTFSVSHGEDQTIHAKSQLHTLDEEQSPTTDQDLSQQATVVQSPADANLPAFNEWSVEQRKAALAPLLAYLRDLDDLARVPEAKQAESSAPVMTRRTDSSRVPQRKASSAAVSVNSSQLPDRSSGYDSSAKGDSTALTSPSSVQGPISKMKDDANKRDNILSEIMATERSYIASLQELAALYIVPASAPLREGSKETVIPQAERVLVFSVVESIIQFHSKVFLPALEEAVANIKLGDRDSAASFDHTALRQAAIGVGEVFVKHAAFMKLYHSYTVNFDTALDRAAMWETFKSASSATSTPPLSSTSGQRSGVSLTTNQRKRIRHLMKTARKDPRHSQVSLGGYLLMPVQRIPRYKMLLERLMDCTPSLDCPDQADSIIAEAFACMSDLAMEMNERKRDNEGRRKLLHWQGQLSRFKSPLVQPHRTVLAEGQMLLERVVKRDNAVVANLSASAGTEDAELSSLVQIPVLKVDRTRRKLIYVLCNDILILILDMESNTPGTEKYETFTVLRLGKSAGGREQPASTFGRPDRLRIVEDRAILYLFCPDAESAQACRDLINRQSLQTGVSAA